MAMNGILVLGPGRSGTSALTRLINMVGPSVCLPEDRMGPAPANPKGFWESTTVMIANELLLQLGGGSWRCPPPIEAIRARMDEPVTAALVETFTTLHPFDEWLCKDPRFAVTMPIWEEALGCDAVAVIAVRDPRQVAASYDRSFPTGSVSAAAVWERSLRCALSHATAGRAIVAKFDRVLAAPGNWLEATTEFLTAQGFDDVRPPIPADIDDFMDDGLFHQSVDDVKVSEEQLALFDLAASLLGHHAVLDPGELPPETPATNVQIDECLAAREGQPFSSWSPSGSSGLDARTARIHDVIRAAYEAATSQTG